MLIDFKRSGGFGNITTNLHFDTAKLPPDLQETIQNLLAVVSPTLTDAPTFREGKPDTFQYDLVFTDGATKKYLNVNDLTATNEMHDLFDFFVQNRQCALIS